jgi:hypothetical protein
MFPPYQLNSVLDPSFELVFRLLQGGTGLPDAEPVLPYIGLYTLIRLRDPNTLPAHEQMLGITTPHLPQLPVFQSGGFLVAPPGISPSSPSTARVFDVMGLPETSSPFCPG